MKIEVEVKDVTWQCVDCGNTYEFTVEHCPNYKLDLWMLKAKKRGDK